MRQLTWNARQLLPRQTLAYCPVVSPFMTNHISLISPVPANTVCGLEQVQDSLWHHSADSPFQYWSTRCRKHESVTIPDLDGDKRTPGVQDLMQEPNRCTVQQWWQQDKCQRPRAQELDWTMPAADERYNSFSWVGILTGLARGLVLTCLFSSWSSFAFNTVRESGVNSPERGPLAHIDKLG